MAGSTRVPKKDSEFDSYINNTYDYLIKTLDGAATPNFERLGVSTPDKNLWGGHRTTWNDVYKLYINPNKRTPVVTANKNKAKGNFTAFSEAVLKTIAASKDITTADRQVFHIKERDRTPTTRGKIQTSPYTNVKSLVGSRIRLRTRLNEDANRASMNPLADAVEIRLSIGTEPNTPMDAPIVVISKKAIFDYTVGIEHAGKRIYLYVRWVNFSNPENNGPWSNFYNVIVQG